MIILGIDPGIAITGFGVILSENNEFKCIDYGVIRTSPSEPHYKRLQDLSNSLKKVIKDYNPDVAAVEDIFMYKNVKTAIKVGQARGVVLLTIAECGIELREFTPLQVKQALTSYGRATKDQMQKMVKTILNLNVLPCPDDAADALAVAVCCAQSRELGIRS